MYYHCLSAWLLPTSIFLAKAESGYLLAMKYLVYLAVWSTKPPFIAVWRHVGAEVAGIMNLYESIHSVWSVVTEETIVFGDWSNGLLTVRRVSQVQLGFQEWKGMQVIDLYLHLPCYYFPVNTSRCWMFLTYRCWRWLSTGPSYSTFLLLVTLSQAVKVSQFTTSSTSKQLCQVSQFL